MRVSRIPRRPQIRSGEAAKPAGRVLAAVEPVDKLGAFDDGGVRMQGTEEVEGGEGEVGEAHAVGVGGGVGGGEEGFQAPQPVFDVALFVEDRVVLGY